MDGKTWYQIRTCESDLRASSWHYVKNYKVSFLFKQLILSLNTTTYNLSRGSSKALLVRPAITIALVPMPNFGESLFHTSSWHCITEHKVNLLFTQWTNIYDGVNMIQGCEAGDNRLYRGWPGFTQVCLKPQEDWRQQKSLYPFKLEY